MACPTAKTTRINLIRPSTRLVYYCNDAVTRIQEGPRPWCTQARSLAARNGEESSRPAPAVYCWLPIVVLGDWDWDWDILCSTHQVTPWDRLCPFDSTDVLIRIGIANQHLSSFAYL